MNKSKTKNIWIIGHIDVSSRSVKASQDVMKFTEENPELVKNILDSHKDENYLPWISFSHPVKRH